MTTINPANFTLPDSPWEMERKRLAKQQAIVDALAAKNLQAKGPGFSAGQFFVPTNALSAIGQTLSSALLSRQRKGLEGREDKNTEAEQKSLMADVLRYMEQMQGKPGTPGVPGQPEQPIMSPVEPPAAEPVQTFAAPQGEWKGNEFVPGAAPVLATSTPVGPPLQAITGMRPAQPGTPGTPAVPGDPQAALVGALSSQHPFMKQMALAKLLQGEAGGEEFGTTPQLDAEGNFVQFGKGGTVKQTNVKGQPKDGRVSKAVPKDWADVAAGYGFVVDSKGPAGVVRIPGESGKMVSAQMKFEDGQYTGLDLLDKSTNVSTRVNVGAPDVARGEWAKIAAEQVKTFGQTAAAAQESLQAVNLMKELDKTGAFANTGADAIVTAKSLAKQLGVPIDMTKLSSAEALQSVSVELWQKAISQMGGNRGVTKEEALEIKKLVPQLSHSREARQRLYTIIEQKNIRARSNYYSASDAFSDAVSSNDPNAFTKATRRIFIPIESDTMPSVEGKGSDADKLRRIQELERELEIAR